MCAMFSSMLADLPSTVLDPSLRSALDALAAAWSRHGTRNDAVVSAARFAILSHAGQYRLSGELYASHPLQVAAIVAAWGFDEVSVLAACCHDVLEDCEVPPDRLAAEIGPEAARIVDGVTKVGRLDLSPDESVSAASMSKFLAAVVDDVRVLAVKLADRLHNLRTAQHLPEDRRQRSAAEALEVFAPLAHRLGLEEPRREMEDLAFAVVHPDAFREISAELAASSSVRHEIESSVARLITRLLAEASLRSEVESRTKHLYSIHTKQVKTGMRLSDMHDLIGVRIIVPDRDSCYAALGVVHAQLTPVPGRFKDFIAIPRPSGYRSLHTTVLFDEVEVEVQIRSEEMHLQARYGVAAHFLYKTGAAVSRRVLDVELSDSLASASSPEEFLERLRRDLAPAGEIVVLTPKGRPVSLPDSATVLDFAYKIHTDVGHRCTGARVNGTLVPIRSVLRTGDVVEVLTGKKSAPKPDWLTVVRTARAREKIRKFLESAAFDPVSDGRAFLHDELRLRNAIHLVDDALFLARLAGMNGFGSTAEMFKALASGARPASGLLGLPFRPQRHRSHHPPTPSSFESELAATLDGLPYTLPRCCRPHRLEHSIGFVSRLHGVSVHESTCESLAATVRDLPPGDILRLMPLQRDASIGWVEVHAENRTGLLRDVSATLAASSVDISWSATSTSGLAVLRFRFSTRLAGAEHLLSALRSLDGVREVFAV